MDAGSLAQFERDGYVIIKNLLSADVVDSVRAGAGKLTDQLAERLVAEGKATDRLSSLPIETRFLKLLENCLNEAPLLYRAELHLAEFHPLFCNEKILAVVRQILNKADKIRIFPNYSIRPKLPNYEGHKVVWHQDAGLAADGSPNATPVEEREKSLGHDAVINCWTPLVRATRQNGCMMAVPGSHKLGIQKHVSEGRYRESEEKITYGLYASHIDPDVMDKYENEAVHLECDPGDVIFFSHFLFHRGGFNTSPSTVRWSVDWRYQDAAEPTFRKENGHIVWSKHPSDDVITSAERWASLALT